MCTDLLSLNGHFQDITISGYEASLAAVVRGFTHDEVLIYKEATMANGTVKWFNSQKGFGFIQPEDGSGDVFVHISAVEKAGLRGLDEGQKVSFDITNERGKNAATNIKAA